MKEFIICIKNRDYEASLELWKVYMTDKKPWEKVSEKGKLDPKQHLEMMNKMIKYMAEKAQKGKDW